MTSSILGCGWLGFPLAEELIASGFEVKGSTTTVAKLPGFAAAGIRPFALDISDADKPEWQDFFSSDIIIIAIPPKENYARNLAEFLPYLNDRKVILISSTSVYGKVDRIVTEESPLFPDTQSGMEMLAAENLVRENDRATILRLGGLTGNGRHPVKHLSGRFDLADPDAPVNLIHVHDAIRLILRIIERDAWGEIFNGVHPDHPTRCAFYTDAADKAGIARPHFQKTGNAGKIVSCQKAVRQLDFEFRHKP